MTALRDDIRLYLESTLGVDVQLEPALAPSVPFHIKDVYNLVDVDLLTPGKSGVTLGMLLLLPIVDQYPGAVTLAKHINQVQKTTDRVVVFVSTSLSVPERRSLIANHINFIQPGYQMFIPELAMDLRESVRKYRAEGEITALLPATQAILLGCLYEGWNSETVYTSNTLMGKLRYSRVTLSKVIGQLLKLQIIHPVQSRGITHSYSFSATPDEVFKKNHPLMRSPVKRKLGIDREFALEGEVFLSGESAVADYTMLAGPPQPIYGMTRKQFDALIEEGAFNVCDSIDDIRAWVEIWTYGSLKAEKNIADEASVLLSLENDRDERVQIALDEIREKVTWLKSKD